MPFSLSFRRYDLPFRSPVRTAHGNWPRREGLILRLEDPAGQVGWGEVAPVPGFGRETLAESVGACGLLGAVVDERTLDAVPVELACLRNGFAAARAGVARLGAPAADPGREDLPVTALLPAGRAAMAAIGPRAEAGFRSFKWKVGVGDLGDELAMLDDVCAALPQGATLRLDANGGWDRRGAERWLERCADRPVAFVEQPIGPDARGAEDLLLGLAADFPTPLALDESLVGEGDIERWLGAGWKGVFVIKLALLGGDGAVLDRLARADAAVVFSSALETAVGAQAALRTAFLWPGRPRSLGFGVWPLFADPRCDGPATAPFIRWGDVERIDPEVVWSALT